jgi:hypothetical protein
MSYYYSQKVAVQDRRIPFYFLILRVNYFWTLSLTVDSGGVFNRGTILC